MHSFRSTTLVSGVIKPLRCHRLYFNVLRYKYSGPDLFNTPKRRANVAINVIFPSLGNQQYTDATTKVIEKQKKQSGAPKKRNIDEKPILNVPDNEKLINAFEEYQQSLFDIESSPGLPVSSPEWLDRQASKIRKNKYPNLYVPDYNTILNDFDFMFPIYSSSSSIDKSMIINTTWAINDDINPEFNSLVELDKLKKDIKFNPMILAGKYQNIPQLYKNIFRAPCDDETGIKEWLAKLKTIGEKSLVYHGLLNNMDVPEEKLPASLVNALCFRHIVIGPHRKKLVKMMMSGDSGVNSIYQYLGMVSLVNKELSSDCLKSIFNYMRKEDEGTVKQEANPAKIELDIENLTPAQRKELSKNASKYANIGGFGLKSIDGFLLLNYRPKLPDEGLSRRDLAILGYEICKSHENRFELYGIKPELDKKSKLRLIRDFNETELKLPVIRTQRARTFSRHRLQKLGMNDTIINRILFLETEDPNLGPAIKQNRYCGYMRYHYHLNIALLNHELDDDRLYECLKSRPFMQYLAKFMKVPSFGQLYACSSEEQRYNWTNGLVKIVKEALSQLNAVEQEKFYEELKFRLLKQTFITVNVENLNSLLSDVQTDGYDEEYLKELGHKFVRYTAVKDFVKLDLQQFLSLQDLVLEEIKPKQMIKIGKMVLDNGTIEENKKLEFTFMKALAINGVDWGSEQYVFKIQLINVPVVDFSPAYDVEPSVNVNLEELTLPKVEFEGQREFKKLLLINYYVSLRAFKKLTPRNRVMNFTPIMNTISKIATLGGAYFEYAVLLKLKSSKYIEILREKSLKKDICEITGIHRPFEGGFGKWYKNVLFLREAKEYLELITYAQMFNQYIGMLYIFHKDKLDLYIDKFVDTIKK
ncbi:hypothetical protein G210_4320 [Candida maltosa Xu316]|uniref:Uncharacterized protein n=1 Tax=Candida maltosa (strain Xu316) TaxID=1245528 RepID=M3JRT0_CANMX|nr:hypothetical protein G210_4320 [Candida maltosa Xu316]